MRQRLQSRFDILDPRLSFPMPLSWKIDYVSRRIETPKVEREDLTNVQIAAITRPLISFEVFRKCSLELESNSLSHNTDRIHGVNERIYFGIKHVASDISQHTVLPPLIVPRGLHNNSRLCVSAAINCSTSCASSLDFTPM